MKSVQVSPQALSKHMAITAEYKFKIPPLSTYNRKVFDNKHVNWRELKEELKDTDWIEVLEKQNADEMAEA